MENISPSENCMKIAKAVFFLTVRLSGTRKICSTKQHAFNE